MKATSIQIKALRAEVGALGDRIIAALELHKPAPEGTSPFEIRVSQDLCAAFLEIKSMLHLYWDKATTEEAQNKITLLGTVTNHIGDACEVEIQVPHAFTQAEGSFKEINRMMIAKALEVIPDEKPFTVSRMRDKAQEPRRLAIMSAHESTIWPLIRSKAIDRLVASGAEEVGSSDINNEVARMHAECSGDWASIILSNS